MPKRLLALLLPTIRTPRLSITLPLLFAWSLNAQAADVASQWLGTSDHFWGTGSNWDPSTVPNNGVDTFDVTFPPAFAAPVVANGSFAVRSVTLGNASALDIQNNATFTVTRSITNDGTISPASTGGLSTLFISGDTACTVTVDGSGAIVFDAATEGILGTTNHTLINESPHTIRGAGQIGVNLIELVNRGTITADIFSGELNINDRSGGMVNEGTLSATGGGFLNLVDPLFQGGGALTVDAASAANVTGAITHSGGITSIDGTLTSSAYNLSAGTLGGGGTLTAPLSTTGPAEVRPSGVLDVTGSAVLGGATEFFASVASVASADRLHSTGALTLADASLEVTFTGAAGSLSAGETVPIANSAVGLSGTFSNAPAMARITSSNNLASFEVNYTPTAVTLTGVNYPLTFVAPNSFSVAESAPGGSVVGTVAATDIEGSTLTYSLDSATPFTVSPITGQITTTAALDFETQTQYTLAATVSDGELTSDTTITITVTNVLEDNREVVSHYLTRPGGPFEGETDLSIISISADPDGDRRANIFELWLGSDPSIPDAAPAEPNVKVLTVGGSDYGAVAISVVAELDDQLAIGAEAAFDLATWRSASSSRTVLSEDGGRRTVQFTNPAALPPSNPRFQFRFEANPDSPNPSL